MSRVSYDLDINLEELKLQIDIINKLLNNTAAMACLTKNERLSVENGLMNLLGTIRDCKEDAEFFKITSVCKEDILQAFEGRDDLDKVKERLKTMYEGDMSYLAEKMASDYCEQLYWDSLRIIFEDRFLR